MKIGLIQMKVADDPAVNIAGAMRRIAAVRSAGAEMAVLPEMFVCPYEEKAFRRFAESAGGPVWRAMSAAARQNRLHLIAGSVPERAEDGRLYNTAYVFGPEGDEVTRYRKMHLFDIDIEGGQRYRESAVFAAGDRPTVFDTPAGRIGVCICFDIRFPELSRRLALMGARLIVVPAAFNSTTGPAHWELAFRGRAVDNQVFTIGVAPARDEEASYVSYGHSLAVSPWGEVVRWLGTDEAACVVELDLSKTDEIRRQLPLLSARRTDLYELRWTGPDGGGGAHKV